MAYRLLSEALAIFSSEPEGSKETKLTKECINVELKRIERAILLGIAGMKMNSSSQLE